MKQILCLFFVFLVTSNAMAEQQGRNRIEYVQPYPQPKVTVEQWKTFHDKIAKEMTPTPQTFDGHQLEVFADAEDGLQISFTTEGHPAHPAWVTRYVFVIDTMADYGEIGYFAGAEEPFTRVFKFHKALTDKMREALREEYTKKNGQ